MSILWLAFITGLTTGGISCLAVQGGLLTSVASKKKDVFVFIIAKLLAYTLLGFILGLLGSSFGFSPKLLGYLQIVAGLFMALTALRLADVHPIFRYFVIQPPRWTYRLLKNSGSAAILGLFTVFMPCGVTQATMVIAIATGSPWMGAAVMGAFILGTSPVFFALGATVVELLQKKLFSYVAAVLVGIFGILSINGGVVLTGSSYTLQNYWKAATNSFSASSEGTFVDGVQEVTIQVTSRGYTTPVNTLKANVPVRLRLVTHNALGCARAFTIPDLGISKVLPGTGDEMVEFTPTRTGTLVYSCSMGMFTGQFTVEE